MRPPPPPIPPFVWGYSPSDVNNFRCHCLRNFFRFPFHLYSIGGLLQPTKCTSQKIFLSPSLVQLSNSSPFTFTTVDTLYDDLILLLLFCLCIVLSFCLFVFVFVIGASLKWDLCNGRRRSYKNPDNGIFLFSQRPHGEIKRLGFCLFFGNMILTVIFEDRFLTLRKILFFRSI